MKLKEFNSLYRYKLDKNYDDWTKCKLIDKLYRGDCESYIVSLNKDVTDVGSLDYYFCTLNYIGHCIGVKDGMWIDCNTRQFRSLDSMPSNYRDVRKMYFPEVWLRKAKGFVLSLFYKEN